jgi:hypothetical protein
MQAVGIDADWFMRPSDIAPFKALLGVAVTVRDRSTFTTVYDNEMNTTFDEFGLERKKKIYKAAYLAEQLLASSIDFIKSFIRKLTEEILHINIYYTFYPVGSIGQIWTCRDSYPRSYDPEKFLDLIYNAYPHYCIWKYLDVHSDCRNYIYESDHFYGKITPAWEIVSTLPNLHLYYKGCECNPLISIADLLIRLICDTMPGRLGRMNLLRCFKDIINDIPLYSYFMGPRSDYLNAMAFTQNRDFNERPFIKRPIYWIIWKPFTTSREEIKLLEWNLNYNNVVEAAERNNGCLRMYDSRSITQILDKTQDKACLMNEEARPILNALLAFAPEIEVLDFRS